MHSITIQRRMFTVLKNGEFRAVRNKIGNGKQLPEFMVRALSYDRDELNRAIDRSNKAVALSN